MSDTANKIAVMQAHLEGQPIESLHRPMTSTKWIPCPEPDWSWGIHDYRIAPHPPEPRSAREWQAGVSTLTGRIYTWGDDMLSGKERFEKITVREVLPEPPQAQAAEPVWQYFRKGNEWWRVRDTYVSYQWKPGYAEWSFAGLYSAEDIRKQGWTPCAGYRYFTSIGGFLRRVPVGSPPETLSEVCMPSGWTWSGHTLGFLLTNKETYPEVEKP